MPATASVILTLLPAMTAAFNASAAGSSLRTRVETSAGIFVVFDAAVPEGASREPAGYLAWWHDFSEQQMYVYDRLIFTTADVDQALRDLAKDLSIEGFMEASRLDSAVRRGVVLPDTEAPVAGAVKWRTATRSLAKQIMGVVDPSDADLPPSTLKNYEGCFRIAAVTAGHVPPPSSLLHTFPPPADADEAMDMALAASDCVGDDEGGGGPCLTPCCGDPCCGDPCCNDRCCQGSSCCGSPNPCCNSGDPCCGNSNRCCNGDNPCCGSPDPCCNSGDPCCGSGDRCCNDDNPCCGSSDPCCNSGDPCCGNSDRCCNPDNLCCGSSDPCCNSGDSCCGSPDPCCNSDNPDCGDCEIACCHSSDPCCNNPDPCCGSSDPCCSCPGDCCGGQCCAGACCNNECCESACCDGNVCCGQGSRGTAHCCGDICCNFPCNECVDHGSLSGGTITVSPSMPCLDQYVTFTLSGVIDIGGSKRVDCVVQTIPPVPPSATWRIDLPDGTSLTGSGLDASIFADVPGVYSCVFMATTSRECPPLPPPHTVGPAIVTLPDVISLVWQEFDPTLSVPLDNSPINGGKRIFPDWITSPDPSANIRRKVKLKATISPAVQGCQVHFRTWDVDDPFDQMNPGMPNVNLIDTTPTSGPDNRPTPESSVEYTGVTGANGQPPGEASVTVTVSMQPGNNYRAGASTSYSSMLATTQTQADVNVAPKWGVVFSPMLTVWRKLHVETDAMARPTFAENTISHQWWDPTFVSGQLQVRVTQQPEPPLDDFENGYIRLQATNFQDLVSVIITFVNGPAQTVDFVLTNITSAQWADRPGGGPGTWSDDDLGIEANFTPGVLGSDIGIGVPPNGYLPLPDTSGLAGHYQPAYVLPIVDNTFTSTSGIPFLKNIENFNYPQPAWEPARLRRGLPVSTSDYWTAYVYSAFQAERGQDFDGEFKATKGISTHKDIPLIGVPTSSGLGAQYTGMCTVFVEALRDGFGDQEHRITVAHEIAHTLGVDHSPGLMDSESQLNLFFGRSLRELREYNGP